MVVVVVVIDAYVGESFVVGAAFPVDVVAVDAEIQDEMHPALVDDLVDDAPTVLGAVVVLVVVAVVMVVVVVVGAALAVVVVVVVVVDVG